MKKENILNKMMYCLLISTYATTLKHAQMNEYKNIDDGSLDGRRKNE